MSEAYLKLMAHVTSEGFITQQEYLDLFAGIATEAELLVQLYEMEQEGIFLCKRTSTTPVYYLADVAFH